MRVSSKQQYGTISVVMPNYNDSAHIGVQLRAICEQSYLPHEVIVIDDGSTDNSVEIVEAVAAEYPFVRIIKNDANRGIIFSVNRAAKLATGDYIVFPSANDLVLDGLFEKSLRILNEYPQAAFCCADGRSIDLQKGGIAWDMKTGWLKNPGYISSGQLAEISRSGKVAYVPLSPTCIFRRELLPEDQIWKPELGCYCDWFLQQQLAFQYGCCFIPEKLVIQRCDDDGYCESTKRNLDLYRQVFRNAIEQLACTGNEELAKFVIRGRAFLAFEPTVRTPAQAWKALRGLENRNSQTDALLQHVGAEYARTILCYIPGVLNRWAQAFLARFLIPVFYYLKNCWDRMFARSFHEYDRLRSSIRRHLTSRRHN